MANETELKQLRERADAIRASLPTAAATPQPQDSREIQLAALRKRANEIRAQAATQSKPVFSIPNSRQSLSAIGTKTPKKSTAQVSGTHGGSGGKTDQSPGWFQKSGVWDDGYQWGDVTKTIFGSGEDLGKNIGAGLADIPEKVLDALITIAPYFAQGQYYANGGGYNPQADAAFKQMNDSAKGMASDFVAKDLYDEQKVADFVVDNSFVGRTNKQLGVDSEKDSVFGQKSDALAQSAGQLLGQAAVSAIPGAGPAAGMALMGTTAFGSEVENAVRNGATLDEAALSGTISAGAELLTEKLGGISFGGKTLTDAAVDALAKKVSSKVVKFLLGAGKFLANSGAESLEEIASGYISAFGQKLTYMSDKEISELFSSEDALESAIGGFVLGGFGEVGDIARSAVSGEGYVAGTPQTPADAPKTAENKTGETTQPQTQTGPTQAVATLGNVQKTLDVVNSTIAQMHGDPDAPLDTALEYFRENGTVSNKLADAISRSPDAVRTLVDEVGLRELPNTASGKRAAIKSAVEQFAQLQAERDAQLSTGNEQSGVKEQIRNNQGTLNAMEPAAQISVPAEFSALDKAGKQNWVVKKLQSTGYKVDRKGFGIIDFAKKRLKAAFKYFDSGSAEEAAFEALPYVLEKGVEISSHPDHKGRTYRTVTIAAPVIINGKRGNMAVVVKQTDGNHYKVHRILTPDGAVFDLSETTNEAARADGGVTETGSLATSNGAASLETGVIGDTATGHRQAQSLVPASNVSIAEKEQIVNENSVDGENSSHESVGAADANFTGKQAYYDLLSDDNVKPGRPGDVRDVEIPETDGYGRRVSDFASNAVGAEVTTDEMADAIKELTGEGALGFDVKSDKSLLTEAENSIKAKGLESSKGDIREAVDKGKIDDVDIVTATLLYNIYNSRGDVDSASEMMVNLATMANDAGRKLRLFGLLRKMTPEGQAAVVQKTVQRSVARINEHRSGKNKAEVTIPQELLDAYTDAARRDSYEHSEDSERAKVEAEQAIYKAAAAQIKASPMEKLNAWRYMAMLGNAKTQIRNFAGNALFRPLVSIKRTVGAAIESVTLEQKDRTKAVLGFGKDAQDLIRWAGEDVKSKTAQDLLSYCGQTGDAAQTAIDENRQIFDTKWLETVREFVKKVPEGADMLFKQQEYSLSLASFLKARGYTAADIQSGKVSQDVLNEGRAYAAQEALKATFNDQNTLSDLITNLRYKGDNKALQLLNILGEGVMPFRRTPANIVARGLEYSPIGLVRGLGNAAVNVRTGKVSAATAIDQIAGGLTGTGMMALGWALASGIFGIRLRGKTEEEEELSGHQSFALEIGGKSYDISWLAPSNIPLLVGANLYELSSKDGAEGNWLVNASSATVTALEPLLELSCLSSLNDVIESVRYGGDSAGLYTIAASAATSYMTQYIPTLLGQVEQAFEDTKKSTYSNADTPLERSLEKTVGQITQRIPGIDLFQTEKVDKWGRTQEKGAGQKIFDAFINPSKVTTIEETAADGELERLRDAVPDENVYPGKFRKEISYTDSSGKTQKKSLTAEEYSELAKVQGQQSRDLVEKISGMDDYKALTDAQKAKVIRRIYDYTAVVSKSAVVDSHEAPSWITNRAKGMSIEEAILRQEIVGTTQLYTDLSIPKAAKLATLLGGILPEPGHTNTRTVQKIEAVTGADSFLSEKEQKDVLEDILPDEAFDKYVEILAAGYSSDDFATAYRIDLDIEGEGAKEKTIRAFMKEFGVNRFAATKLYDLYHPKKES